MSRLSLPPVCAISHCPCRILTHVAVVHALEFRPLRRGAQHFAEGGVIEHIRHVESLIVFIDYRNALPRGPQLLQQILHLFLQRQAILALLLGIVCE